MTSIDPKVASIIVAITLLVSSIVALVIVSRLNRDVMLVSSMLGMALFYVHNAVSFYVDEQVSLLNVSPEKKILIFKWKIQTD
jgi:hypothetical protein